MMNRKNELNVDFIGGERSLTQEELSAISAYIKEQKAKSKKQKTVSKRRRLNRTKASA